MGLQVIHRLIYNGFIVAPINLVRGLVMALKFVRQTLIPLGVLLSLLSCSKKDAENEGFLPKLSEITVEDVLSEEDYAKAIAKASLWSAVVSALKTNEFDTSSSTGLSDSLGTPSVSQFVTDTTQRTAYQTERVTAFVTTASSQWCQTAPASFSIVNPGTVLGLATGGFKVASDGKTPVALTLNANVYLASYKLGTSASNPTRYMFVTVPAATPGAGISVAPDGSTYGYPIAMYAHAATGGLGYPEIAAAVGDLQSTHIVIAPVFPGEPVCKTYDTGTTTCTGDNILVAANANDVGKVYEDDVVDLLGAFECAKRLTTVSTYVGTTAAGTENFGSKYAKINASLAASAYAAYNTAATTYGAGAACTGASAAINAQCAGAQTVYVSAGQPLTYIFGLGRGGNVVNLALARAGGLNSVLGGTSTTLKAAVTGTATGGSPPYPGVYAPEMFSCAAAIAPQSTFSAGFNKIILNSWVNQGSDFVAADKLALLNAAVPGFASMKATVQSYLDDATLDTDAKKGAAIAGYIKKIDGVMHIPLAHGGLQNWGKYFQGRFAGESLNTSTTTPNGGPTIEDAQGAFLVLHGRNDVVANISNSKIYTGVGAGVTTTLMSKESAPQAAPGINWVGLEVAALAGVTDNGHVSDASFLGGKTVVDADSKMVSTVSTTIYVDKTPGETIGVFLSTSGACATAINGQADATNNPDR